MIVNPVNGTKYNLGDTIEMTWVIQDQAVSGLKVDFFWEDVRTGDANVNGLPFSGAIATVPVSALKYSVKVPATLPGSGRWGIRVPFPLYPRSMFTLPRTNLFLLQFIVNLPVSSTSTAAAKTTTTTVKTTNVPTVAATVAASTTTMSGASSVAGKAAAVFLGAPLALALLF
ncbi:hypothetical protein HK101_002931 [Irineochytrium annulatum]|nr:hypothetical protein HK101_002931 [Irineochytrium annulatum]